MEPPCGRGSGASPATSVLLQHLKRPQCEIHSLDTRSSGFSRQLSPHKVNNSCLGIHVCLGGCISGPFLFVFLTLAFSSMPASSGVAHYLC